MDQIVRQVIKELKTAAEPEYKKVQEWFFKEGISLYGVRVGKVRQIARANWQLIKEIDKEEIYEWCEQLLETGMNEGRIVAFEWARKLQSQWTRMEFKLFERWLKRYVSNWSSCDDLCTGPFGTLIIKYPQLIVQTRPWRESRNRWVRRGAAVCLIIPVRRKIGLTEVFRVANKLMMDDDYMVQKGYGWMLKEASNVYPKEVYEYMMKHKNRMPRLALRYAIEKMPQSKRKLIMGEK